MDASLPHSLEAASVALTPPERFEVDSDRLNWPLGQAAGVPGLPDGVAILPEKQSHVAVLRMPCASGKTFTVRRDLVDVAKQKLVVVVTCNRLFTRATCKDWEAVYGKESVYCYMDGLGKSEAAKEAKSRLTQMCEGGRGVLFISIESFLVLRGRMREPEAVGALLLEETCELASKMLNKTCPCVQPFRLLKHVARGAERVIYTDADFEADGQEDGRCFRLARYLCPRLPIRIFTLSRTAEHVKRSAKLYFDHPDAEAGTNFNAWWAQLTGYLKKWQRTGDTSGNRVAVACSSRSMVRRVCALAKKLGIHWCDYTSDTSDVIKNAELAAPAKHWVEVGLVAFTQTLSVGVDPVGIQFAAVFVYAAPVGCSVRCLIQGALRFGRDIEFKLGCTTIFVCMQGRPLQEGALERQRDRTRGTSYFQRVLEMLQFERAQSVLAEEKKRTATAMVAKFAPSSSAAGTHAFGGAPSSYCVPTDEELAIAAWTWAEELEQREDLYSVLKRALLRHDWVENGTALDLQATAAFNKLPSPEEEASAIALHEITVGQQVSSLMEPEQQFNWALELIRGDTFSSTDVFYEHCYGLEEHSFYTAEEKVILRTWMLLRNLPRQFMETVVPEELVYLSNHGEAIELHALGICVGSTQLLAMEATSKAGADRGGHRLAQANRLGVLDEVAARLMTPATPSFFVDPGGGGESNVVGTALPCVVHALELSRQGEEDYEVKGLLDFLRRVESRLGVHAQRCDLISTIRRVCRKAHVQLDVKTRKVEVHHPASEGQSNDTRRLATIAGPQVPALKKREGQIVAVVFKRMRCSFKTPSGGMMERDHALDWKVESPHTKGLMASARDWLTAHGDDRVILPSELRREIEEDLGILDENPNPPGTGPLEDRPQGNALSSGVLVATGEFTPARTPRSSAQGYRHCFEAVPWDRLCRLTDLVSAQLALTLDTDMRTMLDRGRRVLDRLKSDSTGLESDAKGFRWKPTFYARRMALGRLTAGGSSMQPMPNLLRQWLYRGLLHDIDIVNAHPTIMLGLVKRHRHHSWLQDAPCLAEYVANRRAFLDRIVEWYGLPGCDFAKTAILVAINGGDLRWWRRKVKSPVSQFKPDLPALMQLQREAMWVRNTIVFSESDFSKLIEPLKKPIRNLTCKQGCSEEELDRSAFAYVLGHLESMALDAACEVLKRHGFKPTSLIYDGCLVMHNPDGNLEAAFREAEESMASALHFEGLKLKEKDMFRLAEFSIVHSSRDAALQAVTDAVGV